MAEDTVIIDPVNAAADRLKTLTKVMTTKAAIAQTPKELVWTLNKSKLYRYVPVLPKEKRHPIPLLLVFALMNRPYILDLRRGHSFVEYMLNKGYDIYLLDWGAPGPEDKNLRFDDYTLDYMPRAIRKLKAISGVKEFSLLGWCIGAILTTIYAALRGDEGLRNLILLTAPLDFSNKQSLTFARWTDERYFDVDKVLAAFGNMPGEMIDYGAKALKPVENYVGNYVKLWDNIDDPRMVEGWHAMNTWVTDNVPLAARSLPPAHRGPDHTFSTTYAPAGKPAKSSAPCQTCHGPDITTFDFPLLDYNGDGVIHGVQTEVQSLLDKLSTMLPPDNSVKTSLNIDLHLDEAAIGSGLQLAVRDQRRQPRNPQHGVRSAAAEGLHCQPRKP